MTEVTVHNMPSVFVMETEMPISMVNDLKDYLDEYKEDQDKKSSEKQLGFIAQEIKVIENSIGWTDDHVVNTSNSLSYKLMETQLIPILVKALQEADDKIDALTTRVSALES